MKRLLIAVAVLVGMFVAVPNAGAVTITVNTTADQYGGTPANCSLREAIKAAQTNAIFDGCPAGSGADVIVLSAGEYGISIPGQNENLDVTGDFDVTGTDALTIQPAGDQAKVVVNGNGLDRVFDQLGNSSLSIRNLQVKGGSLSGIEDGGGIRNGAGTLTVEGATISGNASKISAGGIAVYSSMNMLNSTVSGNSAGGNGGGIYLPGGSTGTVKSSTITGNTADSDASNSGDGGGFNDSGATSVNFFNVINAGNIDSSPGVKSPDCSSGPNFFPRFVVTTQALGAGNCLVGFNPGTNQVVANPLIGPLADNGGQTQTHALLIGSPAIGAGGTAAPDTCPATDQTGRIRPAGACDIGAVQYVPPPPPPPPVASLLINKFIPAKPKVKRGKTIKVKVQIKNGGTATADGVKVCLALKAKATRKALKIKGPRCKSAGSIAAGAVKTSVFKVSARKTAKKKRYTVVSSVTGTGLSKGTRSFKIKVK